MESSNSLPAAQAHQASLQSRFQHSPRTTWCGSTANLLAPRVSKLQFRFECVPGGVKKTKMAPSRFPYQQLEPLANEIRIIQILPLLSESAEVHCKLRHAKLADDVQYSALSYVWGNARDTKPIVMNGQRIDVTANLETALRRLASNLDKSDDARLDLWVDAICIDQSNTNEKTLQVSMMDRIFNQATQTIFWLGPASRDCDLAIECLRWLSDRRQNCNVSSWSQVQFGPEADPASYTGIIQRSLDEVLAVLCKGNARRLMALGTFFELPWFRRVWVLQEAALSRAGVVVIGHYSLSADNFNRGFSMLCGLRDYLRIAGTGRQSSAVADYLSEKLGKATAIVMSREAVHLRQLLHLLANPDAPLEASDERDFVFAMLGLATDAKRLGIYSDYSKQWDEIRCDVARAFLRHYDLEILSFCKAAPSSFELNTDPENPRVPSWAPNWCPKCLPRPLSIRPRFRLTRGEWGRSAYSASGDVENQRVREEHFLPNGVVLLPAIRIDTVDQLGSHLPHATVDGKVSKMTESLAAWLVDMKRLLPEVNETYKTNEDVIDALWRTPIVDRGLVYNYEMVRADPQLQDGYNDLLSNDSRQRSSRNAVRYADIVRYKLRGRKPFRTCRGMIGIGPEETREGDCVWVIVGADLPFVLRPVDDGQWSIVGEAYVHGIMDGEAMDMGLEKRLIPLV